MFNSIKKKKNFKTRPNWKQLQTTKGMWLKHGGESRDTTTTTMTDIWKKSLTSGKKIFNNSVNTWPIGIWFEAEKAEGLQGFAWCVRFLAHLSTKCSWWAIGIVLCPSSVVRRPSSTCVRSRGHSFGRILMKVGQVVCLDEISDEFENGSCGVKN